MSWSVQKTAGIGPEFRAEVERRFNLAAEYYEKQPSKWAQAETVDIYSARNAALSWIDLQDATQDAVLIVEASGSRGDAWLNVRIDCSKLPAIIT